MLHIRLRSDKSGKHKGGILCRTNVFSQSHSAGLYAEYISLLRIGIARRLLIDSFHPYTHSPHESHYKKTHQNDIGKAESHQPGSVAEKQKESRTENHSQHHSRTDSQKIGERGVTDHTVICMKYLK